MKEDFVKILDQLSHHEQKIREITETIIANIVMISEIPAPTFHEQERMNFLVNRFTACGMQNCSTDEVGNALGILPGRSGERNAGGDVGEERPAGRSSSSGRTARFAGKRRKDV